MELREGGITHQPFAGLAEAMQAAEQGSGVRVYVDDQLLERLQRGPSPEEGRCAACGHRKPWPHCGTCWPTRTGRYPLEDWSAWYCYDCRHTGRPEDHACQQELVRVRVQVILEQS